MKTERILRLIIVLRIVVAILFLFSTIALRLSDVSVFSDHQYALATGLMVLSVLFSVSSLYFQKRGYWLNTLARLQVAWDVLFVTLLLVLTDGIASPFSFLYLLAIIHSGMLLSRQQAFYTAALCSILYGAIVDMQYYGMLWHVGLSPDAAVSKGETALFYNLFLHMVGFALAATLGSYLAERIRVTEDALYAAAVDLSKLKQLHTAIVENIESGLLTLTPDEVIQVFNPYLERLTGLRQVDAYGKKITDVFPGLTTVSHGVDGAQKHEFIYCSAQGTEQVIGYSVIPLPVSGENSGYLLTLKDLTQLKQMQLALQRSDRLAALGELSARMAHEIRNPLAAISGAVQLMVTGSSMSVHDTRLLDIVMRESDRLNGLISDFLVYARPVPLDKSQIVVSDLLDDLSLFVKTDRRFTGLILSNQVSSQIQIYGDRRQLHQALLNILINAAEAMPGGGEIVMQGEVASGVDADCTEDACFCLRVYDTGIGIDPEALNHLFEPFWTKKIGGSGLGLATVYRIMEAHGGTIQVRPFEKGGTVVTMLLPICKESPGERQNTGC